MPPGANQLWGVEARRSDSDEWLAVGKPFADIRRAHESARAHIAEHGGMARVVDQRSGHPYGQFQRYSRDELAAGAGDAIA
jgi:hypothetical protein